MSEQLKSWTPVVVTAGRHAGKAGIVRFYGVSNYDKKQPVVAIKGVRGWMWVRPEQIKQITQEELRDYDRRAYSEIRAERDASERGDSSDETHH